MTMHRYEARADLVPGACEPDGTDHLRPDVICPLRPSEARSLAGRLLALADQARDTRAVAR